MICSAGEEVKKKIRRHSSGKIKCALALILESQVITFLSNIRSFLPVSSKAQQMKFWLQSTTIIELLLNNY